MGTRIRGAVLAFAAAALLAAAAPMPWWSGHPVAYGKVIEGMSVDVTLFGFEGCRGVGGEENCVSYGHTEANDTWHPGTTFAAGAFAAFGAALLAAIILVAQGFAGLAGKESLRRKLAVLGLLVTAATLGAAIVVATTAPNVHQVPRWLGQWFAFAGAGLGMVQAVLARRPDGPAEVRMKPAKAPRPPKPAKPPKAQTVKGPKAPKAPKGAPPPQPQPIGVDPYPGAPSPMDFLALMEADAGNGGGRPDTPPWEQQTIRSPGSSLPGPSAVLGTSMPPPMYSPMGATRPPLPPPSNALAQTMVPRSPPGPAPAPPPQRASPPTAPPPFAPAFAPPTPPRYPAPLAPSAPPGAPTQSINVSSRDGLPSQPLVMSMHPTPPPTAIPLPPLFGGAASGTAPPEPVRSAPPPFRSGKTIPPPLPARPAPTPAQPPRPPRPPRPMPVAAKPASAPVSPDHRASTDVNDVGDATAPTDAVPEGAEPDDTGPLAEPPLPAEMQPPDDMDGRLDTASDVAETIERSPAEAALARATLRPLFGDMPKRAVVTPAVEDTTTPRERESSTAIASPAAMAKAGTPAPAKPPTVPPPIAKPVTTPPPPRTKAPSQVPLSTAAPDLPPPTEGQTSTDGPAPACPQCEAPMTWVEKHLRFFCGSCRMYF